MLNQEREHPNDAKRLLMCNEFTDKKQNGCYKEAVFVICLFVCFFVFCIEMSIHLDPIVPLTVR